MSAEPLSALLKKYEPDDPEHPPMVDVNVVSINQCPRCGEYHYHLPIKALTREAQVGEVVMPFWASCPTNGEPILLDAKPTLTRFVLWTLAWADGAPS